MSQFKLELNDDVVISIDGGSITLERDDEVLEMEIEELESLSINVKEQYVEIAKRVKRKIESERVYYTESQKNDVRDFHFKVREWAL